MTAADMLARVRTMLDESSAGFWTDAEIYKSLSDGQTETALYILNFWQLQKRELPQALRTLLKSVSASLQDISEVSLPSDFLYPVRIAYSPSSTNADDLLPCYIREQSGKTGFLQDNTFLGSQEDMPYCLLTDTKLSFETPVSGTGSYQLDYLRSPSSIEGTTPVNPELPEFTHPAIVQYAFAILLLKDQRSAEANNEYAKYLQQQRMLII